MKTPHGKAGLVAALLLSVAGPELTQAHELTPPPGVVAPFVSPNEGYIFWIDPVPVLLPSGQFNTDFYPPAKILQDVASIDRTGPWS